MRRFKIVLHKEVILPEIWFDEEWWEDVRYDRAAFVEGLEEDWTSILYDCAGGIDGMLVSYEVVEVAE